MPTPRESLKAFCGWDSLPSKYVYGRDLLPPHHRGSPTSSKSPRGPGLATRGTHPTGWGHVSPEIFLSTKEIFARRPPRVALWSPRRRRVREHLTHEGPMGLWGRERQCDADTRPPSSRTRVGSTSDPGESKGATRGEPGLSLRTKPPVRGPGRPQPGSELRGAFCIVDLVVFPIYNLVPPQNSPLKHILFCIVWLVNYVIFSAIPSKNIKIYHYIFFLKNFILSNNVWNISIPN